VAKLCVRGRRSRDAGWLWRWRGTCGRVRRSASGGTPTITLHTVIFGKRHSDTLHTVIFGKRHSDGIIEGRVFTTACGGPSATGCAASIYRGSLVFCSTMHVIGPCPSARVDATGHYQIKLSPGRHALIPAPGSGNVVYVKPRWVVVVEGQTQTLDINGGNLAS
jgi:hypothetical protein